MPYTIALAGKGGSGKTTMAGLLIKYLVKKHKTPILAVHQELARELMVAVERSVPGTG